MKNTYTLTALTRLALGATLAAAGLGCRDVLVEEPESFITPDVFYRTAADAEAAVNAAYAPLLNNTSFKINLWQGLDIASDEARAAPTEPNPEPGTVGRLAMTPNSRNTSTPWPAFYSAITRANDVIDRVPAITMDSARKASIIGEASFVRALSYFYLVRLYGPVPLIVEASDPGRNAARAPAEEVYARVVADAEAAARALPARWTGANVGRATRGAALTLLADVYLTRKEYARAAAYADSVIQLGAHSLAPNYALLFTAAGNNNPEHIFSIQAPGTTPPLGSAFVFNYYPRELGVNRGGGFAVIQPTQKQYTSYLAGDYRHEVTYATRWTAPDGRVVNVSYPHVAKYRPTQTTILGQGDVNIPLYRYAEVLLIQAEALNELGRTADAVRYLNEVRARARRGTGGEVRAEPADYVEPLTQDAVREAVYEERRWELAHEAKRWLDLIRRGDPFFSEQLRGDVEVVDLQPTDMLWPVPQSEIDVNPALTQNPGY